MYRGDRGRGGNRGGSERGRGGFRGDRGGGGGGGGGGGYGGGQQGNQVFSNPQRQDPKVGQAEDALRPATKTALSISGLSLQDSLPIRPSYGTVGNKLELTANYVEFLPSSNLVLFRYDIQISPQVPGRKHFRLVELLLQSEEVAPHQGSVATDFRSTLLSRTKLSADDITVKVQYRGQGEDEPPAGAPVYTIHVKFNNTLSMSELVRYLTSTDINDSLGEKQEWEQALNIFLNHHAKSNKNIATIGSSKSFSLSQSAWRADLGNGLEVIRGFFSSVHIATCRILVNVNVSHAAFYRGGPLSALMNSYGTRSTPALERFLKLVRVQTTHLPEKRNRAGEVVPRVKTIFGLARNDDGHGLEKPPRVKRHGAGAKDVEFFLADGDAASSVAPPTGTAGGLKKKGGKGKGKDGAKPGSSAASGSGKYISVFDFFKSAYNRILRHPELPLINCGNRNHPMYLPVEVCIVPQGQPSRAKLDGTQTQQMIRHAVRKPWENAASITTDGMPTVGLDDKSNVLLNTFGFRITPNLIKVPGRLLIGPKIIYKDNKSADTRFGSWNMANIKFNAGVVLSKWSYVMISPPRARDASDLQSLMTVMNEFHQALGQIGIRAAPPKPGRLLELQHPEDPAIGAMLQQAAGALELLVVVLPEANISLYKRIKTLADKVHGIHTICCVHHKLAKERGRDQYMANIALKLNLKLGGVNQMLENKQLGIIAQDKTMVVGIDVTHPSPGSSSNAPSVSAMVASINKSLGQWPATLRVQAARQEKVADLTEMLKSRLHLWQTKGKHAALPENILVYRDGVSEGQHDMVLSEELPQLRRACEQTYPATATKNGLPRITIIICGKRHKTRFYPTTAPDCDRSGNTKPGTVVDRGVTEARNWDFFLQAHAALQGTARPCHYYVVHDEIFRQIYAKASSIPPPFNNVADVVEALTHNLCYSFGRATKAVSLCTPAYYADIVCERARCYLSDLFDTPSASAAPSVVDMTAEGGGGLPSGDDVEIHRKLKDTMFYI